MEASSFRTVDDVELAIWTVPGNAAPTSSWFTVLPQTRGSGTASPEVSTPKVTESSPSTCGAMASRPNRRTASISKR